MIALSENPNIMKGRPAEKATDMSMLAPGTAAWELRQPRQTTLLTWILMLESLQPACTSVHAYYYLLSFVLPPS